MADLKSLIAELEQADGGSEQLDIAIFRAISAKPMLRPHYTTSLDAALTLVREQEGSNLAGFLHAVFSQQRIGDIPDKKIALAVCIKALKARDEA